jgi:hypothetical protein
MERLNNFTKFELIKESLIYFSSDFIDILSNIIDDANNDHEFAVSQLAIFLQFICGKDINLSQNYIDVADNGLVKYIVDNRIDYNDVQINYDYIIDIKHIQNYISKSKYDGIQNLYFIKYEDIDKYKNSYKLLKTYEGYEYYIFLLQLNEEDSKNEAKNYPIIRARDIKDKNKKHILLYKKIKSKNEKPFVPKLPKNFSEVRLGRFINKTLQEFGYNSFKSSTIEKFVNYYTSLFVFNRDANEKLHIVSGDEIRYYYYEDRYEHKKGYLGSSCMRHKSSQANFNIYIENPDVCKMLVMTGDKEDSGPLGRKIIGRALLWTLIDGSYYMDRIYAINDSVVKVFEKYAKDNNYIIYNAFNNRKQISVKVKSNFYNKYPFMDTFEYYLPKKGILTNYSYFTDFLDIPNKFDNLSFIKKIKLNLSLKKIPDVLRLTSTSGIGSNTGWILDKNAKRGYTTPRERLG